MRSTTDVIVWAWSQGKGVELLSFPSEGSAWQFCADHPNDWIRVDKVVTTVIFDKQDPLGLDTGTPTPIMKEDHP